MVYIEVYIGLRRVHKSVLGFYYVFIRRGISENIANISEKSFKKSFYYDEWFAGGSAGDVYIVQCTMYIATVGHNKWDKVQIFQSCGVYGNTLLQYHDRVWLYSIIL